MRAERLENPEDFVPEILAKVKREHVAAQYKLPKDGPGTWSDANELMEMISKRSGRLLKGGDACLRSAAIMLINDFQRGRLPHYVAPPELKGDDGGGADDVAEEVQPESQKREGASGGGDGSEEKVAGVTQDLDAIGEEFMHSEGEAKESSSSESDGEDERGDEGAGVGDSSNKRRRGDEGAGANNDNDPEDDQEEEQEKEPQTSKSLIATGEWDD